MASVGDVVEISSDEEEFSAGKKLPVDPFGWASDLFDVDVQDDAVRDDLDELMVMSEWSSPPALQKMAKPDDLVVMNDLSSPAAVYQKAKSGGGRDEESKDKSEGLTDDDECMVLDGDPDKAVTVGDEDRSAGDSSSDELQIVAEKGPLACRDFPHSRHLCSNFPFNSTSHVKYCNKCHCFVCDVPAPCKYWGNGTSVTEHCHATDKERQWKDLRQVFKFKSLSSSCAGKHQSVPCSTLTSPRQQDMHFQVSVPHSLPSLAPNMDHHSLSNRSPLVYDVSQNQQRNPSVRVSLCLSGTVSTPRAGRGTANPRIAQNTRSHAIFKRAGSFPPNAERSRSASTPDNSLMNQTLPNECWPVQIAQRTNAFTGSAQDNAPLRSFSAPLALQVQQGQPAAYDQVAPKGKNVTGPQLSRHTSLSAQRTQCMEGPVIDVSTRSWQDILASVASDLGVPDYNISTGESQHVTAKSGPVHSTVTQELGLQHELIAATDSFVSSHAHDPLNHTTGGPVHSTATQELGLRHDHVVATDSFAASHLHDPLNHTTDGNIQANGPPQTTDSMHHLNSQSSIVPNEAHEDNFASGPVDDLAIETDRQLEISGLESNFMFEFDWS